MQSEQDALTSASGSVRAAWLASCTLCEKLHVPAHPLEFWPICAPCSTAARHEAGHAVVIALLYPRGALEFAARGPDPGSRVLGCIGLDPLAALGFSTLNPRWPLSALLPSTRWKRRMLAAFGTICYAGVAAEHRTSLARLEARAIDSERSIEDPVDDAVFGQLWEHSERDRVNLATFAQHLGLLRPANHWHAPSWKRAQRLLSDHCVAVDAIEDELLARRTVTRTRVEALVKGRPRSRAEPHGLQDVGAAG